MRTCAPHRKTVAKQCIHACCRQLQQEECLLQRSRCECEHARQGTAISREIMCVAAACNRQARLSHKRMCACMYTCMHVCMCIMYDTSMHCPAKFGPNRATHTHIYIRTPILLQLGHYVGDGNPLYTVDEQLDGLVFVEFDQCEHFVFD